MDTDNPRNKIIASLVTKLQKAYGETTIGFANELMSPTGRWSTGILSLDYLLGGGLPKGRVVQFKGADSSGKSSSAVVCAASVIRQGGAVFWIKGEDFDRMWARKLGLVLPPSKEEEDIADELADLYGPPIEAHQFVSTEHMSGDIMLEASIQALRSGAFDLIIIDSIASLTPDRMLDKDMTENEMRMHKPAMNTRWGEKVYSAFALHFDPETLAMSDKKGSVRNNCSIIVINQFRDHIAQMALPPEAKGGWMLKHLQRADVKFSAQNIVAKIEEKEEGTKKSKKDKKPTGPKEKKKIQTIGAQIDVVTTDSQICPKGRMSSFNLYTRNWSKYREGLIDHNLDIITVGMILGVIIAAGSWFEYEGHRFHGKEQFSDYLDEHPEDFKALEELVRSKF